MIETILIFIFAAGILYYLYITLNEYLGNENNQKRFIQDEIKREIMVEPPFEEKIKMSEFGTLSGILGYVANADGEICALEKEVAKSMFEEMARGMNKIGNFEKIQDELEKLFFSPNESIESLAQRFCELTKGEYRKKLKVVEFCFVLGYADGGLNESTKEAILDIGALLEIDNDDFNALYNDFAEMNFVETSLQEAKEIFGETTEQNLDQKYVQLISESKQNFTDDENSQPNGKDQLYRLRKIHQSYELLKKRE